MSSKKVYVGSIPGNLSEEEVLGYFQQFVPNIAFSLNRNLSKRTTNSGFGFLTVYSSSDLQTLLATPHFLQGRQLKCQEYLTGNDLEAAKENLKQRRLFVRGFKKGTTDQELLSAFSAYGQVESAYVVKIYSTGEPMGYGYVTLKKVEVAERLLGLGRISIQGTIANVHPFVKFQQASNLSPHSQVMGESTKSKSHQGRFAPASQREMSGSFDYTFSDSSDLWIQQQVSKAVQFDKVGLKNGSLTFHEKAFLSGISDLAHSTKPTSRSFYRSRSGFGDHSSANIVLNVVSMTRWASKMLFRQ